MARAGQIRADMALVEAGLFESRAKAREAIEAGLVTVNGAPVAKASIAIPPNAMLRATAPYPWVSRGGVKLAAALDLFGFDPTSKTCLDLGASTGGFTQVLLARGAARVVAVDVGHGQLHPLLASDPLVTTLENTDARTLTAAEVGLPALLTFDLSFISLRLVLPPVLALAAPSAAAVMLIKPQFEAGPSRVKKGIVRDPNVHTAVCADIAALTESLGWSVIDIMPSPIEGGDGNKEFLLGARR